MALHVGALLLSHSPEHIFFSLSLALTLASPMNLCWLHSSGRIETPNSNMCIQIPKIICQRKLSYQKINLPVKGKTI